MGRLSGGEQARVLIARLMLEPADVLLLDEPTNDLDIPTLEVLEESLLEFPGALVLVTHDRYLLDRVSTGILALDGAGGAGCYADYAQWEAARGAAAPAPRAGASPSRAASRASAQGTSASATASSASGTRWSAILEAERRAGGVPSAALADPAVASDRPRSRPLRGSDAAQAEVERLYARWAELEAKQSGRPEA